MNNQEAIKELEYVKIKLKEANIFISPSMDIAINMAKEALQFQDIMVSNPKSAKPTPEVCKTCIDNKQDDWIPVSDDDLPKEGADVIVSYRDGEMGFIFSARPELWNMNKYMPIAWMPAPTPYPYKGGDKE